MLYVHVVILKRVCEPETKLPKGGGKKKKPHASRNGVNSSSFRHLDHNTFYPKVTVK
jgi:hypothetical protein